MSILIDETTKVIVQGFTGDKATFHAKEMIAYGKGAAGRGLKVIIAGAGGAAHLPGMVASVTPKMSLARCMLALVLKPV